MPGSCPNSGHTELGVTQLAGDRITIEYVEPLAVRGQGRLRIGQVTHANPVPLARGGETPIQHVLFVIRENKTYDALLGDYAAANGVAENCLYCGDYTPNLHALAARFASGDNYYSNAEASVQGHALTTGAISNAFTEKNWFGDRGVSRDLEQFANASEWPKKQFLFQALLAKGIPFKSYGDQAGLGPDLLVLNTRYVHWGPKDPPLFWLNLVK